MAKYMLKKMSLMAWLIFLAWPGTASAYQLYEKSGPALFDFGYDSSADSYVLYFNYYQVVRIEYGLYGDSSFQNSYWTKTEELGPGEWFQGVHYFRCNGYYKAEYFNSSGSRVGVLRFHATEINYPDYSCPGSDGDSGDEGGGGGCGCECLFNTPGWAAYMRKIDDIIDAIPPPPDWEEVADTFYYRVGPRMVADFEQMLRSVLGTAPNPPGAPTKPVISDIPDPLFPGGITDRGIQSRQPSFAEPPELGSATFNKNKLEQAAPTIQERQDTTGGFSILNPIAAMPELPSDDFPVPGQTDAGEWDHQPAQPEIPFPDPPTDQPTAPTDPPIPDDGGSELPMPGGDSMEAPIPGGGEYIPDPRYKTHPDNPDGV